MVSFARAGMTLDEESRGSLVHGAICDLQPFMMGSRDVSSNENFWTIGEHHWNADFDFEAQISADWEDHPGAHEEGKAERIGASDLAETSYCLREPEEVVSIISDNGIDCIEVSVTWRKDRIEDSHRRMIFRIDILADESLRLLDLLGRCVVHLSM